MIATIMVTSNTTACFTLAEMLAFDTILVKSSPIHHVGYYTSKVDIKVRTGVQKGGRFIHLYFPARHYEILQECGI